MDLIYALFGRLHAGVVSFGNRERGQGTVEYVGIILLLAVVLAGVVKAAQGFSDNKGIAHAVINKLRAAIGSVKPSG